MRSSLRLGLLLLFVAFPLIEIAILIKSGETIGFWRTIGLLFAAALLGFIIIREQGLSMVGRMFTAMNEGRLPFEPLLDGYIMVMAGFLLILPGFLSDAIGLLLLVPPLRRSAILWSLSGLAGPRASQGRVRPTVIEGTYERLNEKDPSENGP